MSYLDDCISTPSATDLADMLAAYACDMSYPDTVEPCDDTIDECNDPRAQPARGFPGTRSDECTWCYWTAARVLWAQECSEHPIVVSEAAEAVATGEMFPHEEADHAECYGCTVCAPVEPYDADDWPDDTDD